MKYLLISLKIWLLLLTFSLLTACRGQDAPRRNKIKLNEEGPKSSYTPSDEQIAQYIRNIYQDKNGGLWFGTNGRGVAHYDGDSLYYFSQDQGFAGQQVTAITEDLEQNIWFSTNQGVVKYDWSNNQTDQKTFTNYPKQTHFKNQHIWSIFADSQGRLWVGSEREVFQFDGQKWEPFPLPYPEKATGNFVTDAMTRSIIEDRNGHIWFSTYGFGVFVYNGETIRSITKEDGLSDNNINHIFEDSEGNIWFASSIGGLFSFDGEQFKNYTQNKAFDGSDDVYYIHEDSEGNIWFSSKGYGIYRFDGKSFTNFYEDQGLRIRAVQVIFEDREGRFWVGGGNGLYRFNGQSFFNVLKKGPWD